MSLSWIPALNHHPTSFTPTPNPPLPPIPSLTHTLLRCHGHSSSSSIITNNLTSSCTCCNNSNFSSSDTSNSSRNPTSHAVYSTLTIWSLTLTHPRLPLLPPHPPSPP